MDKEKENFRKESFNNIEKKSLRLGKKGAIIFFPFNFLPIKFS